MYDDDRDLLGPTEGDPPSPEFVEDLWGRLDAAWDSRDVPTSIVPSPTAIDVTVLDKKDGPMGKNRLWMILGAAAALVIVIGGIVAISNRDDDPAPAAPTPTTINGATVTQPPTTEATAETVPSEATTEPSPTTEPPLTAAEWPSERPFGITYIDVDAGSAVAASDDFAWVVGNDTGLLSTIDLATNTVISTAEVPAGSVRAWYAFESVWIGNEDDTVARYDPAADAVVATIDVGGLPWWLAADDDALWVATQRGGEVVRIDPETNTVAARIPTGGTAVGHGGTSIDDHGVWVRKHSGQIVRIDPATNMVVTVIDLPSGNAALTASPDAIWAPLSYRGVVSRIDPSTNSVVDEVDINAVVGADTRLFDLRYVGDSIWVVFRCSLSDKDVCSEGIARIDPVTNEVVAVESLPEGWQAAWMSGGPDTAWTFTGNAIARIDP